MSVSIVDNYRDVLPGVGNSEVKTDVNSHTAAEKPLTGVFIQSAPSGGYVVYEHSAWRMGNGMPLQAAFSSLDDALMWIKQAMVQGSQDVNLFERGGRRFDENNPIK